jgi:hypothetical protein
MTSEIFPHRKSVHDSPIGVQNEGDMLHLSISEPLLESDAKFLKACTGFLNVIDGNCDVTKATSWLTVSTRISLEIGVGLSTVIVGQLQNACMQEKFIRFLSTE